jgi:tRNA A-37 threonylcarbamoyl transferase component Bud32
LNPAALDQALDNAVMSKKVRIIRGDFWADRLQQALSLSTSGAAEWMEEHTQIVKSGKDSMSGLLHLDGAVCFLKLYRFRSVLHRWLPGVGTGRALRNFSATRDLYAQGLAVPRPLACLLVPQGMLLLREGLPAGGSLDEAWPRNSGGELVMPIMRAAGETLATLHQAGYAHGDCKWQNLFWDGQRVFLLNLDSAQKGDSGGRDQARDLARFTVSAEQLGIGSTPYEHFLTAYFEGIGSDRREVQERMLPQLSRLRKKHPTRQGPQGQRLV